LPITLYRLLLPALLALTAACASPTLAPRPTPALVRVAVTDLTQPLLLDLAAAYATINPDVVIAPTLAPPDDLGGMLASSQSDLDLTTAADSRLFATPIGYVPFTVVVHPGNPLAQLSLSQAQGLLSGRLSDWGQVGGPAGPVQVVTRGAGTSADRALADTAMGPITPTASARSSIGWIVAPTWAAMRQLVGQNPNAIGYLIGPETDGTVKALPLVDAGGAPVPLRLLAVAQAAADPTGAARDFLAWAQSPAGQAAVARRNVALQR